jgi:hypothetical protein
VRRTVALGVTGLLTLSAVGAASGLTESAGHPAGPAAGHFAGHAGHARAVAEAKALISVAPTLSNATSVAAAPVRRLAGPPQGSGDTTRVVRKKFWTVDESYRQAYADLTATPPSGLTEQASGGGGGPKRSDVTSFAIYAPKRMPAGIDTAELDVVVTPTGSGSSAIGVYAQAVPIPPRPAAERVPASLHRVRVAVQTKGGHLARTRVATGAAARKLVSDFNALTVVPPGEVRSCPADLRRPLVATFHAGGHAIVATTGSCDYVVVTRCGKDLKALEDGGDFDKDIRSNLAPRSGTRSDSSTLSRLHRPKKPARERIPASVHKVRLVRRNEPYTTNAASATVTGKQARTLVRAFNRMKTEPTDTMHCDLAGGPEELITFRTARHTWRVQEAACTNVMVRRDGKDLPTLISNATWDKAVAHDLGH